MVSVTSFESLAYMGKIKSITYDILPGGVLPVYRQTEVGLGPRYFDLVPLEVIQPQASRAGNLGLSRTEVDVYLKNM